MNCGIHMRGPGGVGGSACPICAQALTALRDSAPTPEARGKAAARANAAKRASVRAGGSSPWRTQKTLPRVLVPVGDGR